MPDTPCATVCRRGPEHRSGLAGVRLDLGLSSASVDSTAYVAGLMLSNPGMSLGCNINEKCAGSADSIEALQHAGRWQRMDDSDEGTWSEKDAGFARFPRIAASEQSSESETFGPSCSGTVIESPKHPGVARIGDTERLHSDGSYRKASVHRNLTPALI